MNRLDGNALLKDSNGWYQMIMTTYHVRNDSFRLSTGKVDLGHRSSQENKECSLSRPCQAVNDDRMCEDPLLTMIAKHR